jgi:pimeloyl-ACP methyl ester carboxylesterase
MIMASARENQTITLPDGRLLGYAEFGDYSGYPLFFFHGFPSSRLEARGADKAARQKGVRIVALDRPGCGLSTFQPGRSFTDWPDDVLALAKHLKLDRFAILGGSGGGPYAIACAHAMDPEMLLAVGVMSCAPPWEAGSQDMPYLAWFTSVAAYYSPWALGGFMYGGVYALKYVATSGIAKSYLDQWLATLSEKKKKNELKVQDDSSSEGVLRGEPTSTINDDPAAAEEESSPDERRRRMLRIAFEPFAQGAEGFVREAQLLCEPDWGFRFEDVKYDKIMLWHGMKDTNAPIRMILYMKDRLPHSEFKGYDENHFGVTNHLDEILSELMKEAKLK